jgi:hypothetical protein
MSPSLDGSARWAEHHKARIVAAIPRAPMILPIIVPPFARALQLERSSLEGVAIRTGLHKNLPSTIVLRFPRCTFTVLKSGA